ncbi:uncharacterized protein I303_104333 [Kwoniella dejecticola CBS 10117]|uniref:Ferric-chelate reductase n=1 Tax=Kwoniella dejecticola CBS 10117 TaxID=1296121 RepID=A0A1A6A5M3_9TREE|nr:ferric-chelate reductase [Kwoniella dejecticola CBS 10117]OBR85357.1 ferric-chelate reductase [Kwoniella dejecticola CBS 10117]
MTEPFPSIDRRFIPIPTQYQIYDSYTVDPQWQTKFTIIWTSILALSFLLSITYIAHSWKTGRLYSGLVVQESLGPSYSDQSAIPLQPTNTQTKTGPRSFASRARLAVEGMTQSLTLWTVPMPNVRFWQSQVGDCCRRAYFTLSVSQIILVIGCMATTIACFVVGAELTQNSNRPGFIALAQLPVIILLSLKSPLPLPIFLPSLSYEHYNFLHRWTGRTLFVTATVHGGMWINQFIRNNEMDQINASKSRRGILAYALMGMVVITSLKPVRRKCYQLFWIAHVMFFVGFFAAISYHTPYSRPWIYPCVALYAYDLFVRMLRYRIKDATLVPVDDTLTMIHIPDCDSGWLPTQHVFVRVLKGSGVFESHPFTITNAPSTPFSAAPRGIVLYAKVAGDWTRKVHNLARDVTISEFGDEDDLVAEREKFLQSYGEELKSGFDHPGRKVQVMIDGPYGGLKIDLGQYENVLLVGGGSGITFILGAIEECLRIKEKAGRGISKVEVAWVVRDMSTVQALTPTLSHLHNLSRRLTMTLTYHLYLSNPPHPLPTLSDTLPASTTLSPYRPEVSQLVRAALPVPCKPSHVNLEMGIASASNMMSSEAEPEAEGGGLAVVACGPEGIVMETKNAIATIGLSEKIRCGGIGFHGECYTL